MEELHAIEEALASTRSRANLQDRDLARTFLVSELLDGGVMLPPPTVDFYIDRVIQQSKAAGALERMRRQLADMARLVAPARRVASEWLSSSRSPAFDYAGARAVMTDPRRSSLDVSLVADAQEVLAVGPRDLVSVWLDYPDAAHKPADADETGNGTSTKSPHEIAVYRGDFHVGFLTPELSEAYRPVVAAAKEAGVLPVVVARRRRGAHGLWSLRLGFPWVRRESPPPGQAGS
jgi:hypothetical protein